MSHAKAARLDTLGMWHLAFAICHLAFGISSFAWRQANVQGLRFAGTNLDRGGVRPEAVLPDFDAVRSAGKLDDDAASAFGTVPALAVDHDDGVGGLDANAG